MSEPYIRVEGVSKLFSSMSEDDLNLELLKIWQEAQKTVLFVTHNIGEAILLGDRVLVISERPCRVRATISIDLKRPRSIEARMDKRFKSE